MSRTWKRSLLALPGVVFSLLPKLACPLCWPAYAGLLGSVGLGFLISAVYLLPLTAAFLVFAFGGNGIQGEQPSWVRPIFTWVGRGGECPAGEVCVGV